MFDMCGEHQVMCRSGGKDHDWRRESAVHTDWSTQKISRRNLIVVIVEGHYRRFAQENAEKVRDNHLAYIPRMTYWGTTCIFTSRNPPPTPNPYYMR